MSLTRGTWPASLSRRSPSRPVCQLPHLAPWARCAPHVHSRRAAGVAALTRTCRTTPPSPATCAPAPLSHHKSAEPAAAASDLDPPTRAICTPPHRPRRTPPTNYKSAEPSGCGLAAARNRHDLDALAQARFSAARARLLVPPQVLPVWNAAGVCSMCSSCPVVSCPCPSRPARDRHGQVASSQTQRRFLRVGRLVTSPAAHGSRVLSESARSRCCKSHAPHGPSAQARTPSRPRDGLRWRALGGSPLGRTAAQRRGAAARHGWACTWRLRRSRPATRDCVSRSRRQGKEAMASPEGSGSFTRVASRMARGLSNPVPPQCRDGCNSACRRSPRAQSRRRV